MSVAGLDIAASRAGRIDCACGPQSGEVGEDHSGTWRLALGFGFAVLAQALMLVALPVAGATSAPRPSLANLPYALTLLGAVIASFPASLLLDQFGRRAAFALGASLGMAGGLLAGWAIMARNFPGICVGACWLGTAQGFSLFYRHAAASAGAGRSRAALSVLAAGCIAGLIVPGAISLSREAFGPFADAALMLMAGIASFAALPFMLTLPHRLADPIERQAPYGLGALFWAATASGAFAWFAMAHVMAGAPSALIGCGLGATAVGGLVSWHLVAMYGPMALASRLRDKLLTALVVGGGIAMLSVSIAFPRAQAATIELFLVLAGIGWSLTQIGVSRLLYDRGGRSSSALALHDSIILAAALGGVLSVGSW